ncbi:unnamed protein product [Miscanthus lutarioriparius]|uniref:[RNA-polymerase]-subunit kinase n=1 Tax=Miscanthus lutarioriparius TaxID=422564 RepID=A0A811MG77_9POAL|nr:unnamed protein product [Miscanthus lutarioriparius]
MLPPTRDQAAGSATSSPGSATTATGASRPGVAAAAGATTYNKRSHVDAFGSTDDYEEMCCLGKGAFGAVAKARHRVTGETVAIKRITEPDGGGPEELLREARLHEACGGHPFIVDVHGLVRDPATTELRLVMECVGGPSIEKFLRAQRRRGGLPLPEATASTYEPDGTLWYMAPEVLLEKPDCDALVDTWSLGCVMAELINGQVLFEDGRDEEGQARSIFDVLGYPDDSTWPWFSSTPFATELLPILDDVHHDNHLRKMFPEALLSQKGFEVLNGLLTCNPDKRLTATAALKHPWFAKVDAMELLRNEEVESALPKKQLLVAPLLQRVSQHPNFVFYRVDAGTWIVTLQFAFFVASMWCNWPLAEFWDLKTGISINYRVKTCSTATDFASGII